MYQADPDFVQVPTGLPRDEFNALLEHTRRLRLSRITPRSKAPPDSQSIVPLPVEWTIYFDETTRNVYYYHEPTGTVQWEYPTEGNIEFLTQQPSVAIDGSEANLRDEDAEKSRKSNKDRNVKAKRPTDPKDTRVLTPQSSKVSERESSSSEIGSDMSSSKHKAKKSTSNPLLQFLAGGKKN